METLLLLLFGLGLLTILLKQQPAPVLFCDKLSTSSIDNYSTSSGSFGRSSLESSKPAPIKEENADLEAMDEKQLMAERDKLEQRLKKISKKFLTQERKKLEKRLAEIKADLND